MKRFTKIVEEVENKKLFKIKVNIELLIPADNEGEASYITDSTMSSIKNMSEYVISNIEESNKNI